MASVDQVELRGKPESAPFPEPGIVRIWISRATANAAISAHQHVQRITNGVPLEVDHPKDRKNKLTEDIDSDAVPAMRVILERAPFQSDCKDSEGGKEASPEKLGKPMPTLIGTFGNGIEKLSFVNDPVENTTAATHGRANAVSIIGLTDYNNITEIPLVEDGDKAHYFAKLFAPSSLNGVVSLEMSTAENLHAAMKELQIPASRIRVAVMDRKANLSIIESIQKVGAEYVPIKSGDLMWCLEAISSDLKNPERPILMMGRGGAEEGSIAAIGAHARGAVGQLRVVPREDEEADLDIVKRGQLWNAEEFITGQSEHSMVIFSAITKNLHFDIPSVYEDPQHPGLYVVTSAIFDSQGVKFRTDSLRFQKAA